MIIDAVSFAPGGAAIAHTDSGKVVFVNGLFPGESALVSVKESHRDYIVSDVLEILSPSPDRRESCCPNADKCGGCCWICLSYDAQLAAKSDFVKNCFPSDNILPPVCCPSDFGYRSRVRFVYGSEGGRPALGFRRASSDESVFIKSCPVCSPALNSFIENPPRLNTWELPDGELACIVTDDGVLYDSSVGWITVSGRRLPVSNNVFFQSNLLLLPNLISDIRANVVGSSVMDLYSGVGTFSAFLEDDFDVTAVEMNKSCLNLARMHLKRTKFFTSPVEHWRPSVRHIDTVIVDPPRTGLDKRVPAMIASWHPERIIYVSCYLPTQARDVKLLKNLGYDVLSVRLYDFYPNSPHIETAVLLTRKN